MSKQEEFWTTKDGRLIAVSEMEVEHVRNALRMVLRNKRLAAQAAALRKALIESMGTTDFEGQDGPDNHQSIASMERQYGERIEVRGSDKAGMAGGDVYIDGQWHGWFGGIR